MDNRATGNRIGAYPEQLKSTSKMSARSPKENEFQQREQELKEREMKVRLRELEAELDAQRKNFDEQDGAETEDSEEDADSPEYAASASPERGLRKTWKIAKFTLLAIGVAATIVMVKVMLPFIIILGILGFILYGVYIFFIQDKVGKDKA